MVHVARLLLRVDANQYGNTPGNEERRNAANRLRLSNLNPAVAHFFTVTSGAVFHRAIPNCQSAGCPKGHDQRRTIAMALQKAAAIPAAVAATITPNSSVAGLNCLREEV
jgi:hypothetical protein